MDYSNVDGPVYGEQKKSGLIATYGILGFSAFWTFYCVVIGVTFGLLDSWEHFAFTVLMLCTFMHLLFSFFLWKKSDQEETRFLINAIVCVFIVFLCGLVMNIYVWSGVSQDCSDEASATVTPTCNIPQCSSADGFYLNVQNNTCVQCNGTIPYTPY